MPKSNLLFLALFLGLNSQAQTDTTDLHPLWSNPEEEKTSIFVDTTNSYQVVVPDWLELVPFAQDNVFGGLLPDTFGVRNAILIKSYPKDSFDNLSAFTMYIYGHVVPGTSPLWNKGFVCGAKRQIRDYQFLGYEGYSMELIKEDKRYQCDYILVETETAFLWIDYTSTAATHDINQVKMFEFLRGFSY